ncbi:MAG: hypothetical protein Q9O24_04065 [Gammaproteobacteria bacterium]|nr:hypothetical protein [Gammaproteobacteria bacterium]
MQIIPKKEEQSIQEQAQYHTSTTDQQETQTLSNHSANLIDDWKHEEENEVWK